MNEFTSNTEISKEPTGPENVTACCRILLADDDLEMRKILGWFLRDMGFEVTECSDGDCLLKRLGFYEPLETTAAFDLIISDIRMPGVTGMQVLESAYKYQNLPPMILITAFGDEITHARAKKLGAAAMLDKPFDIEDLLAKVVQILPSHLRSNNQQRVLPGETAPIVHFPVSIKFRHGCEAEPARELILELAEKLNRFDPLVQHLRVVIDQSNPEEHRKHRYLITFTVTGPGKKLIAKRNSDKDNGHENLYLAIQMAFSALYRQVKKHQSKLNSHKSHPTYTDEGEL